MSNIYKVMCVDRLEENEANLVRMAFATINSLRIGATEPLISLLYIYICSNI